MSNACEEKSRRSFHLPLLDLLFWPLFFFYIYFVIEPFLVHYSLFNYWLRPPYVPGSQLFADLPDTPGKPVMYVAARLLHVYYFPWLAALIVTATAWLLSFGAGRYFALFSKDRLRWLRFVPALIVLLQYSRYYHYQMENLSLALGLFLTLLYAYASIQRAALRFLLFLFLSGAMYFVAAPAYLLFVTLCVIYEIFAQRRWLPGLAQLLSIIPLCWAASAFAFDVNFFEAVRVMLPYVPALVDSHGLVLYYFQFIFFPAAGLLCVCWDVCAKKIAGRSFNVSSDSAGDEKSVSDESVVKSKTSKILPILEAAVVLIVIFGAPLITADQHEKQDLRMRYFSQHKMWPEVLKEARRLGRQSYSIIYCHNVDRALYHSGRLLDDLFAYPQKSGWQLYKYNPKEVRLGPAEYLAKTTDLSETYFEMGRVNDAENNVYEALMISQYSPIGLRQAALINIVKGRPESARTFLRALREDFIYRDEAQEWLDRLAADTDLSSDEEIQHTRALMIDQDAISDSVYMDMIDISHEDALAKLLQELLDQNKHNRMAFEYLMAHYLLTNQLEKIYENITRLTDFNYTRIPRACEEALLVHTYTTGLRPDLKDYKISEESTARLYACNEILARYNQDLRAAFPEFAAKYGDSYFFYNLYGICGKKQ
ncbi:hypothetical protein JXA32_01130 [Candidatus Sumerlaeota bacterium]|nr:hypothetical protein [Candidatus Sumerlaeota bacterium]